MKKKIGYRVYRELIHNGKIVHKTPLCRTGNIKSAYAHARVWGGAVYACFSDGAEERL